MSAPTDLELMMYFDGELDEPRASEVRAFVEGSARARQKLDGLSLVGVAVEERARARESSFPDLTDSIMARVSAEAAGRTADAQEPHADRAPEAPPVRPKPLDTPKKLEIAAPAANDNGRLIFGLAAFAAVAAAALFMWGRSPEPAPSVAAGSAPELAPLDSALAAPVADAPTSSQRPSPPPSAPEDEAPPPSAEVAAVDFGSRNGMVYYVAVANQPTTTTVVWVRDE
ncbi:MAG: hypothetical protein IPG04_27240 [Polyangiaceae bacterium]|nr:hypothetical protein [Polyangiaceae bacterium]